MATIEGAPGHGKVAHLLPQTYKRMIAEWLEEDTPSFDYGGFVVGDDMAEAKLLGKSEVCFLHSASWFKPTVIWILIHSRTLHFFFCLAVKTQYHHYDFRSSVWPSNYLAPQALQSSNTIASVFTATAFGNFWEHAEIFCFWFVTRLTSKALLKTIICRISWCSSQSRLFDYYYSLSFMGLVKMPLYRLYSQL